ncbi:MarR family transcriptional regulator [Micrococcaceae bacterium Sec5.7]
MGNVNRPIGYWLKRLDGALENHLDATLAHLKLTRRQWQIVNTLAAGSISPDHLSEVLHPFWRADGGDSQEREMAALVGRGLMILVDGQLALSDLGRARHAEAQSLVDESRRDLTAGIGMDEYAMAVSVLERMCGNAERL